IKLNFPGVGGDINVDVLMESSYGLNINAKVQVLSVNTIYWALLAKAPNEGTFGTVYSNGEWVPAIGSVDLNSIEKDDTPDDYFVIDEDVIQPPKYRNNNVAYERSEVRLMLRVLTGGDFYLYPVKF